MNKQNQSISEDVMQKIKQGDVQMKPRQYFTLLSIVVTMAVLLAGLAVSYLSSIIFFWIRIESSSRMAYGARRNLSEAIAEFPWWAVFVAVGLVILAVILVRKHGTMYRHKASTVTVAIVLLSLFIGFIMYTVGIGEIGNSQHGNQDGGRRGQGRQQNQ